MQKESDDPSQPWLSTHGMELLQTGGGVPTYAVSAEYHPELAAAAFDSENAVIQYNGESFLAPISQINHEDVELACNRNGVALVADDGDDSNNITVDPNDPNIHWHADGSVCDVFSQTCSFA